MAPLTKQPPKLHVNYNRPLHKKVDAATGIEVYMYLDMPGVYYNSFETEVAESLAEAAGFDVAKYAKARKKRELMAIAMKGIEHQLEMQEENPPEKEVVEERGGFAIVHIGMDRHIIEDPDGGKLVDKPLTLAEAEAALNQLVPIDGDPEEEDTVEPVKSNPFVKSMAEVTKTAG